MGTDTGGRNGEEMGVKNWEGEARAAIEVGLRALDRENATNTRIAELENALEGANRRAEYWKAEHIMANEEIRRLRDGVIEENQRLFVCVAELKALLNAQNGADLEHDSASD